MFSAQQKVFQHKYRKGIREDRKENLIPAREVPVPFSAFFAAVLSRLGG
jgi:hypothetical protein